MAFDRKQVFGIFLVCLSFGVGQSLKCYVCSSGADANCGKTWGYSADSSDYLTECVGDVVACKKLDYEDHQQETIYVTRSCWNTTDTQNDFDMGCSEFRNGNVCYCRSEDDTACNGGQLIQSHTMFTFFSALSTLSFTGLYMKP